LLRAASYLNRLNHNLAFLGDMGVGKSTAEQSVIAIRAALEEWTRERAPHDWALANHNLCIGLRALGERVSGTALQSRRSPRTPPRCASP
jgi:hypothetical protein